MTDYAKSILYHLHVAHDLYGHRREGNFFVVEFFINGGSVAIDFFTLEGKQIYGMGSAETLPERSGPTWGLYPEWEN